MSSTDAYQGLIEENARLKERLAILERLRYLVGHMRSCQREYFRNKNQHFLHDVIKYENEVDELLKELAKATLFPV